MPELFSCSIVSNEVTNRRVGDWNSDCICMVRLNCNIYRVYQFTLLARKL